MKNKNIIIVGYGSIGKRHAKNIKLHIKCNVILLRKIGLVNKDGYKEIYNLDQILNYNPLFVLICNPTKFHFKILNFCLDNNINFLCEKPLVSSIEQLNLIVKKSKNFKGIARIAYNLRYNPVVIKIKELLKDKKLGEILYSRFFVGQYLPDWRKKTNHLENYSVSRNLGGGVVLDLSHELDIANLLIGKPRNNPITLIDKIGNVTVDSEDISEILYKTKSNKIVSVHLNYLIRKSTRKIFIFTEMGTLKADLLKAKISVYLINEKVNKFKFKNYKRNDIYVDLIIDFYNDIVQKKSKSKLPSLKNSFSFMESLFEIKKNYEEK